MGQEVALFLQTLQIFARWDYARSQF